MASVAPSFDELSPYSIVHHNSSLHHSCFRIWIICKSAQFGTHGPKYDKLSSKFVYGGEFVYDKSNRRTSVLYRQDGSEYIETVETVFGLDSSNGKTNSKIVILRLLEQIAPDTGNTAVSQDLANHRCR